MEYLIGIDIGTSGTKSVLFDTKGNVIASALEEYPMLQPQNGWAEQNPNDWWQAVCKTLNVITKSANNGKIVGVGLSGQMHGLVMLDENNEVIRNAIIWCDTRTSKECREIEENWIDENTVDITNKGEYDVEYPVLKFEYIPHKNLCGFKKQLVCAGEKIVINF